MYLNNLFSGNLGENIWRLVLVGGTRFSLNHNLDNNQWIFETRNIVCYIGIFLAFLNYLIIPKLGDNLRKVLVEHWFTLFLNLMKSKWPPVENSRKLNTNKS